MIKSNINSIRLPVSKDPNQESIIQELYNGLPAGWSTNEKNEVLNELGLVMVNIEEREEETQEIQKNENEAKQKTKEIMNEKPEYENDPKPKPNHQLPKPISELLNELELEEIAEEKLNQTPKETSEDTTSFSDSEEEIDNKDFQEEEEDLQKVISQLKLEQEKEDLKSWGSKGLEGLKNAFQSNLTTKTIESDSSLENLKLQNQNLSSSTVQGSKPKKSVSFALDPDLSKDPTHSTSTSNPSSSSNPSLPIGGIMLPDIIEHPIKTSSLLQAAQPNRNPINGQNAHLNPRLASLLPKSYLQSHQTPTENFEPSSSSSSTQPNHNQGSSEEEYEEDYDEDQSDEDDEGLYELSEEEEDQEGWSNDVDLQTALDMREAALEYHSKRQSLGIGIGSGSLGGEDVPIDENEEEEWVPLDHQPKANGIPRQVPSTSRFKSGRLSRWKSKMMSSTNPNLETEQSLIKEGKLLGIEPIVQGRLPINGSTVYQLPSRTEQSTELDEDLTAEEIQVLSSRLNILSMDEESRIAAERAGHELMGWMEKVKKGEVLIQQEEEGFMESQVNEEKMNGILESKMMKEVVEVDSMEGVSLRSDLPPEIKIVKKSNTKLDETGSKPQISLLTSTTNENHQKKGSDSKEISHTLPVAKKLSRFKSEKLNQQQSF
ncbi:uncharacterized protein MELLADRAFT_113955 [Melampsora larici-populina 98AG31]|uniref:DUF3835 domain-containing protein n=1 Tax=Melampsora larici-populina (strain 98AG31 / pathotype 3-4-7) TaxID=747676 RepID=F4SBN2_MELLP|nr:uncharacterized protein MELLADRAFT_113955 [Melampsora larici-populina 98AG31]EGF97928.1 hypothetical protein MELLADRAFT_113955 [Melampsora larici-populina 98AG31]